MTMLERIHDKVGKLPYMTIAQARKLEAFFDAEQIGDCLELGFYHGVSSAYIAEMVRQRGGRLTTIDRDEAREKSPNITTLLAELGLSDRVTVHFEPRCYTWRLMRIIEANPDPVFDFCYIDGGHSWSVSGFGFFLVEKLLRPGGWILFDDLDWSYQRMIGADGSVPAFMRSMPPDEIAAPQVRKIWELLVKPHPSFHNFREAGQWGFAQKRG